eukprot:jgi/Undpi1/12964/HiC_scaffold_7.g02630.m1
MAPVDLANEWKITDLVNSTVEFLRTSTTDVAGPFSTKTQDDVKGAGEQTMRIDDFSGLWFSIPTATTSTHDLTITMRPYSIRTTYNDLRDGTGDSSTPVILTNTKSPPVVEPALVKLLSITKGFMLVCFEFCVGLALAKMWQWKAADFMNGYLPWPPLSLGGRLDDDVVTGEVDNYPHKIEGEETDERDAIDIAFLNDI